MTWMTKQPRNRISKGLCASLDIMYQSFVCIFQPWKVISVCGLGVQPENCFLQYAYELDRVEVEDWFCSFFTSVPGAFLSLCFVKHKMIASNFLLLLTGRRAEEQHVSGFRGLIHSVLNELFKSPCYRNTSPFWLNSVRCSVILNFVWHWNLRGVTDLYKEVMLRRGVIVQEDHSVKQHSVPGFHL